jgi:hypothetical protein
LGRLVCDVPEDGIEKFIWEENIVKKTLTMIICVMAMGVMFTGCGKAAEKGEYDEVISSLKAGQAYAYVDIAGGEHQALLVADDTYDDGNGHNVAISAALYCLDTDGSVINYTNVLSEGTAYPIAVKDGYLYYGGNHHVAKEYIDLEYASVMTKEDAEESFDENGNEAYYYFSLDDEFEGEVDDDSHLMQLFDEYGEADVVDFTVVD